MTGREVMNMKRVLFALGQTVATPGAMELMRRSNVDGLELLQRHVIGDWGDLNEADKQENELFVKKGSRILSAYGSGLRPRLDRDGGVRNGAGAAAPLLPHRRAGRRRRHRGTGRLRAGG